MAINWSNQVNTDFYAMQTEGVENIETLQFESGKVRTYLKNSSPKKAHSLSFSLRTKEEEVAFWNWYETKLLSRTQAINLTDLVTHTGTKTYIMTTEPVVVDSQYPKECQITLQEE